MRDAHDKVLQFEHIHRKYKKNTKSGFISTLHRTLPIQIALVSIKLLLKGNESTS